LIFLINFINKIVMENIKNLLNKLYLGGIKKKTQLCVKMTKMYYMNYWRCMSVVKMKKPELKK